MSINRKPQLRSRSRQESSPETERVPRAGKFPVAVRLAILIGVPALLWTGIFWLARHLG